MAERPTVARDGEDGRGHGWPRPRNRRREPRGRASPHKFENLYFSLIHPADSVEIVIRSRPMKVDSVALPIMPGTQPNDLPIIKVEEIKSILYLGIKGEIKLETGKKHSVDTYA
jgi:hypothetical protein